MHAAFQFQYEHRDATEAWLRDSNFIVVLQVPNEESLHERFNRLPLYAQRVMVNEPDIGDQDTAFAVLGLDVAQTLSDLPLALRERAMA